MAEPRNGVPLDPEWWRGTETEAREEFVRVRLGISVIPGTRRDVYVSPFHRVGKREEGLIHDADDAAVRSPGHFHGFTQPLALVAWIALYSVAVGASVWLEEEIERNDVHESDAEAKDVDEDTATSTSELQAWDVRMDSIGSHCE